MLGGKKQPGTVETSMIGADDSTFSKGIEGEVVTVIQHHHHVMHVSETAYLKKNLCFAEFYPPPQLVL